MRYQIVIIDFFAFYNYLYALEKRTVIEINETKSVGSTHISDPAADGDCFIRICRCAFF